MEAAAKAMELFDRKLTVNRVDERLTLGLYVPMRLEKAQDSRVDDKVRLLAFPHSQGEETTSRLMLPTKKNYQLYYDDDSFQLYENQRSNSWVFIGEERRTTAGTATWKASEISDGCAKPHSTTELTLISCRVLL